MVSIAIIVQFGNCFASPAFLGKPDYHRRMRNCALKFCLILCLFCLSAGALVLARQKSETVLDWIPAPTRNLIVLNPPYAYDIDNEQLIDTESKFEFMKIVWILRPPPDVSEREFRWIKPSEIAQCAYLDLRKNSSEVNFCCIAQLQKDDARDKELLMEMQKFSAGSTVFDGTIIYKFDYENCQGPAPEFKALIAPGVMVCASSSDSIIALLECKRMNKTLARAYHANKDWRNISDTASYWGFRTFNDAEKAEMEDENAAGYNFSYSKKTLNFSFEYITAGTYDKNQKLKLIFEDGAIRYSKRRQSSSRLNFFSWTYPATKPKHWSEPIQGRVMMVAHDFNEVFEYLRKSERLQKRWQK